MQLIMITNAELRSSLGTADKYWHLQGNITKEIFDKLYNNEEEMKKKVVINAELVGSPSIVMGTGKIVGVGRTITDGRTQEGRGVWGGRRQWNPMCFSPGRSVPHCSYAITI